MSRLVDLFPRAWRARSGEELPPLDDAVPTGDPAAEVVTA